jgi:hypothetical protein
MNHVQRPETVSTEPDMWLLSGIADRDPNEVVAMFFPSRADADEFARDLPGTYLLMPLHGLGADAYDRLTVGVDVYEGESK